MSAWRIKGGPALGVADHIWTIEEIIALVPEEDVVILK